MKIAILKLNDNTVSKLYSSWAKSVSRLYYNHRFSCVWCDVSTNHKNINCSLYFWQILSTLTISGKGANVKSILGCVRCSHDVRIFLLSRTTLRCSNETFNTAWTFFANIKTSKGWSPKEKSNNKQKWYQQIQKSSFTISMVIRAIQISLKY